MKLDLECVRSVMLCLESNLRIVDSNGTLEKPGMSLEALCELLPDYRKEDIFYSLYNLDQAGYINISVKWLNLAVYYCFINHITYSGHEFLEGIRDTNRWSKIKGISASVRDYSLSAISSIAEGVTSAAISHYFSGDVSPK